MLLLSPGPHWSRPAGLFVAGTVLLSSFAYLAPASVPVSAAALNIAASGQPSVQVLNAVGQSTLWSNAGTIDGQSIDLQATVLSLQSSDAEFRAQAYSAGNDPSLFMDNGTGTIEIEWRVFAAGTTTPAVGSPTWTIQDIDGNFGNAQTLETVIPSLEGLQEYAVEADTELNTIVENGSLNVSGRFGGSEAEGNQPNGVEATRPQAAVRFGWNERSRWRITYQTYASGRAFNHDGNGDFTFTNNLVTNPIPQIDLDADDSSTEGEESNGYLGYHGNDGQAVLVVDTDLSIDSVEDVTQATVRLTNSQAGDELLVAGTTTGTVTGTGITYTVSGDEVNFSGTGTPAEYQTALQAVTYNLPAASTSLGERTFKITVATASSPSNEATATILFTEDTDGDLVPDAFERAAGTNISDPLDFVDTDGDLVPDYIENQDGTATDNAAAFLDTDGGGVPDYVEETYYPNAGLPVSATRIVGDDGRDSDGDGTNDYSELVAGTNPLAQPQTTVANNVLSLSETGDTDTISFVLSTEPSENVTLTLTPNPILDYGNGFNTARTITFTPANYQDPVTVTVGAADNQLDEGETYAAELIYSLASGDLDYGNYPEQVVPVTITNDDRVGLEVTPGAGLNLTEAGAEQDFSLQLSSQPTANVTVSLVNPDETRLAFDKTTVTFTPENWNQTQTVSVGALADDNVVGEEYTLSFTTTSADEQYAGLSAERPVNVSDDDTPVLTLEPTSNVDEGASGTTQVRLSAQPTTDVTVALSVSDETKATATTTEVTFTSENWNEPQTVTYAGQSDSDFNDESIILTASVVNAESDPDFANLSATQSFTVNDRTMPSVVLSAIELTVAEAGGTASLEVSLGAQPNGNVTVDLSTLSDRVDLSNQTLTFTPENWQIPQAITVTGVDDNVDFDDTVMVQVSVDEAESDVTFTNTPLQEVEVTLVDDDTAGLTVTPLRIEMNEEGSGAVSAVLNSEPTGPVTVNVTADDESRLDNYSRTLTFTPENWNEPQSISFDAPADTDVIDNTVDLTFEVADQPDTTYTNIASQTVEVDITDIDAPALQLDTSQVSISEDEGNEEVSVVLTRQPQSPVTITLESSDSAEATVTAAQTITFTPENWDQPQSFSITGVPDRRINDDTATITLGATTEDTDFAGLTGTVLVTLEDTDVDTDGDLVPDDEEEFTQTDASNPADYTDTDGDLVPDYVETTYQPLNELPATDPNNSEDVRDTDEGGTPDYVETVLYPNVGLVVTSPEQAENDGRDTDGDGVGDYRELLEGTGPDDALDYRDTDGDLVPDAVEEIENTNASDNTVYRDTDADLVPDYVETVRDVNAGADASDPNNPESYLDTDNDLVPDYVEVTYQPNFGVVATLPNDPADVVDTDGGLMPDYTELTLLPNLNQPALNPELAADDTQDTDGDGVPDYYELITSPRTDLGDPTSYLDSDEDGHPDYVEELAGSDSLDLSSVPADTDGDGVPDVLEVYLGSDPLVANSPVRDTDGDGHADYLEIIAGSNSTSADSTPLDSDDDGVADVVEIIQGTDPNDALEYRDTDGDLVPDYVEVLAGSNPASAEDYLDSDGSGTPDYVEAVLRASLGLTPTDPNSPGDDNLNSDGGALNDYQELLNGSDPTVTADDLDLDLDQVDDEIEKAAPNNGDSNGDGIQDYLQTNVSANINPVTGAYATLEVQGGCDQITGYELVTEGSLAEAENFDFEIGLHDFELRCATPGETAQIKIYWDQAYDTDLWTYRKYYPATNEYRNINGLVTTNNEEVPGRGVITVSNYEVVDGGDLDLDGAANGVIIDPAGPAVSTLQAVRLLRTGGNVARQNVIPILMVIVGVAYLQTILTKHRSTR